MYCSDFLPLFALAAARSRHLSPNTHSTVLSSDVQHDAHVFVGLLARRHPGLAQHLAAMDIHPLMYVPQWFMCAFTALPLWDTTLAVWDLLLLAGECEGWGAHRLSMLKNTLQKQKISNIC